jgi:hypothetical protein
LIVFLLKHRESWQKMASKKEFIQSLKDIGHAQMPLPISSGYDALWEVQDWATMDHCLGLELKPGGLLFPVFAQFGEIAKTEHILAIRTAPDDEDGIWHDDGSRDLAFTVSFNKDPKSILGGELLLRKKGEEQYVALAPPPWGFLTVIKTGRQGYEHRVLKVSRGVRMVCAGWINYSESLYI